MTEGEWFTCVSPHLTLEFLGGTPSNRKRWLWAVACCRTAWKYSTNWPMRVRQSVEEIEREAERLSTSVLLPRSAGWAFEAPQDPNSLAHYAAQSATIKVVGRKTGGRLGIHFPDYWDRLEESPGFARWQGERSRQCVLLRVVAGNPFRAVPVIDPSWLTSIVADLARATYESRDFSAMPVLADALQDAGCDNTDILGHCRGDAQHVRGCWVVDLLLDKA